MEANLDNYDLNIGCCLCCTKGVSSVYISKRPVNLLDISIPLTKIQH